MIRRIFGTAEVCVGVMDGIRKAGVAMPVPIPTPYDLTLLQDQEIIARSPAGSVILPTGARRQK